MQGARKKQGRRTPDRLRRVPQKKKGLKTAAYRLRPDQIEALRQEALRRAVAGKPGKPDASEIVRAALDLWFAKHRPKS
jgi:hypothetical protein